MQSDFNQNLKFPISRSNIPELSQKEKITTIGKVDIACGESTLLNFSLKFLNQTELIILKLKTESARYPLREKYQKIIIK